MFKGSVIDSEYKGLSTVEIMNMLAPDAITEGNHEIDYGIAHLLFIERCARFPIVNANLFIRLNHTRLFTPYVIREVGGLKVMFIGILTDEVLAQTKSDGLVGSFIDVRAAAKEVAVICDTYKTTDVDLTVLLTHIGIDRDRELASLIDKNWGVDLIIGGHTHTLMEEPKVVNGIPIVQAGTGTDQIGRFELTVDAAAHRLTSYKWKCLPVNDKTAKYDPAMDELISRFKNQTDMKYGRIVTRFARTLTHPTRTAETELGNLFSDLLQAGSSFDLMVLGSGSIRLPKMGPTVTYKDLTECFPYDDPLYLLGVTAGTLKKMLAFVLREEAFAGHTEFYQYSSAIGMTWSRGKGCFTRFELNGAPPKDDAPVKIALQKYHYENFADFFGLPLETATGGKKPRLVATSLAGVLEELLAEKNLHDARVDGRLTITE